MQIFRDIVVMPTQGLLTDKLPAGARAHDGIFRGGPVFPFFPFQFRARHCRRLVAIPRDRRPRPSQPTRTLEAGVWCGPVCPHFGHMIADFGMRIVQAAHRTDLPLLFSVGSDFQAEPPDFFHDILRHLGVAEDRILLIREPTQVGILHVPAQAERYLGKGPSRAHLDLMDTIVAQAGPVRRDIDLLYVSRSRFTDGRLAAEAYVDAALTKAGAIVIQPERLALTAQLAFYSRAKRIVFSEGSAVHALQLLGRLDADVAILVRRPGTRLARRHLAPRVRSLAYWEITTHLIHGCDRDGKPHLARALSLVDEAELQARFREIGHDIRPFWDSHAYSRRLDADIRRWIAYRKSRSPHSATLETIGRCLRAADIQIVAEDVWESAPAVSTLEAAKGSFVA